MEYPLILDGTKLANTLRVSLKNRVEYLINNFGISPKLSTILVGDDPSSEIYVRMKEKACRKVGINFNKIHLPEKTTTEQLISVINYLNKDSNVNGILL